MNWSALVAAIIWFILGYIARGRHSADEQAERREMQERFDAQAGVICSLLDELERRDATTADFDK